MTSAPKKTRWWKTALKVAVFLVVFLVTLAVLFAATLSFLGRRDWARVKAELLARGERLSLSELQPPPIPESQNFFAEPMWDELTDLVDVEVKAEGMMFLQKQIRLPEGKRQLDGLNRPLTAAERTALRAAFPDRTVPDNARAASLIAKAYEQGRELDPAAQRRNAEFILAVMPMCEPVLSRLDEQGERPGAWLAIGSPEIPVSAISQVSYLMSYGGLLGARCWAELVLGKGEAAARDAVARLLVPETLAGSPLLISILMRIANKKLALESVREGLARRAWNDRELAEIERALAGANYPAAMALALRGERGFGNQIFERIYRKSGETTMEKAWSTAAPSIYLWIFGAGEDARRNMIYQSAIDVLDKTPTEGLNARTFGVWDRDRKALQESAWNRLRYRITAMTFPNFTNIAQQGAILQDSISLARVAVALERYRLRHGTYPEALAALVPEFLPAVPLDVATLQPLMYARKGESFSLWSPGWDAVDGGGGAGDVVWGE
jgi:hypothetical protein